MATAINSTSFNGETLEIIAFRLHEPQDAPLILKAYADNFATNRKQPWTH